MVYMIKFTIALLGAIFVALIACSIQSISADHESDEGIFKDKREVNLVTTQDSDYQVYLHPVPTMEFFSCSIQCQNQILQHYLQ